MSEQRKISSRKVLRFSIGAILVTVFMVALVAASRRQDEDTIKGLDVSLNDDKEFSFLQREDIEALLLKSRNIDLKQTAIDKLDLKLMEAIARTNPWVEKAEVYVDNREVLKVNITQREPVARIFDISGRSYYMDSSLHTMPVGVGYAYPLPVFTSVPVMKNETLREALNGKIGYLSRYIGRDTFWRSQITQIDVQPDQTFVMTTLFGDQKILFGDTSDVSGKLNNLLAFYKNISSKIGWDKYQTLDVRYRGQVVASPSLGWVPPKIAVDTSIGNLEGPPPAVTTAADVKPSVPDVHKEERVVVKPVEKALNKANTKVNVAAQSKPVKPVKSVVQARVPAPGKKAAAPQSKQEKNTQSPKYIYKGNKGNH